MWSIPCVKSSQVYVPLAWYSVHDSLSSLNLYPSISLFPSIAVASASVATAVTVILFVVLVAVGVKSFGCSLSIIVTFPVAYLSSPIVAIPFVNLDIIVVLLFFTVISSS